ncbi:MAG: ATP-binding protein [Chlamydiota bacterium]
MRQDKIIGRELEKKALKKAIQSKKAEFIAVYGRRRVGKTYLIREYFSCQSCVFFQITGIQGASVSVQLKEFSREVGRVFYGKNLDLKPASNWMNAFQMLADAIENCGNKKKIVIFFDEFPWMALRKTKLLQALDYYWNRYWVSNPSIKLIVCGSAASWIIKNILNSKGGLHNRVTMRLSIAPFSLFETQAFLQNRGIRYDHYQVIQLYMCIGGVPYYLDMLEKGLSPTQNINQLCFQKKGTLFDEFNNLFISLFTESEIHKSLILFMAKKREGVSRKEIEHSLGYTGGRLTLKLTELEEAGFITSFLPWERSQKGQYYKIIDEYVLFYLTWIAPFISLRTLDKLDSQFWIETSQTSSWKAWAGLAFEALCFKHISQIKKALKIPLGSNAVTWKYIPKSSDKDLEGAQIDLLFDRNDGIITLCEIKYSNRLYSIDKECAKNIKNKIDLYKKVTKTEKQLFFSMITTFGVKEGIYKDELVNSDVVMEDFFK